jgi:hypothetical protein
MNSLAVADVEEVLLSKRPPFERGFPFMYAFNGEDRGHQQYVRRRWPGLPGVVYREGVLDDKWEVACTGCMSTTVLDYAYILTQRKFMSKLGSRIRP